MNLLEFLESKMQKSSAKQEDYEDDSEAVQFRFKNFLLTTPAAVEGASGNDTTFHVAWEGRGYGLSEDVNFELMRDFYNPRCEPPWPETWLKQLVSNAYQYTSAAQGALNVKRVFEEMHDEALDVITDAKAHEERAALQWSHRNGRADGPLNPNMTNAVNFCLLSLRTESRAGVTKTVPNELYRLLRYNQFSNQIEFTRRAPWHQDGFVHKNWEDSDAIEFRLWLSRFHNFEVGPMPAQDAAVAVARFYQYHPVREYVKSLKWDGVERLHKWLAHYCGADYTRFTSAVGEKFLIAAVARVFIPGCQSDSMLVLEGFEGMGKTSIVRILGGPFYADIPIDPHHKDTTHLMQGSWFLENAELDSLRRIEMSALKRFLTLTVDKVRLSYARNTCELPRQNVWVGTVNPDGPKCNYLMDVEGNRRFWPVFTRDIKLAALKKDRNQLFAEAYHYFLRGKPWHLDTPELVKDQKREVALRLHRDLWADVISDWMASDLASDVVTTKKVALQAIGLSARQLTGRDISNRIAVVMGRLGYKQVKRYDREIHTSVWAWVRDDAEDLKDV